MSLRVFHPDSAANARPTIVVRRSARRWWCVALAGAIVVAGCSGDSGSGAPTTEPPATAAPIATGSATSVPSDLDVVSTGDGGDGGAPGDEHRRLDDVVADEWEPNRPTASAA